MLTEEIENIIEKTGINIIYVDDNVCDSMLIPGHCGIYIITTESGKRYVGSSKNILNRLRHHVSIDNLREGRRIKEPITSISVYLTENERDARMLERWFIQESNPELNWRKHNKCKMSKTAPIDEDVHALIIDKQEELKRKYNINLKISEIIALCVKHGVGVTEELLGFTKEKIDATNGVIRDSTVGQNVNDQKIPK